MKNAWVGIDIGKEVHWVVAIDDTGGELLFRRVENSETDLLSLIAELEALCRDTLWAVDMRDGPAALAIALLLAADRFVAYIPGVAVSGSCEALAGESKTDRREVRVIAEKLRLRRDLAGFPSAGHPAACTGPAPVRWTPAKSRAADSAHAAETVP